MSDLMKDPMFFYSIAFVIFLGLAYRYGKTPLLQWLDHEIKKISDKLNEAQRLRTEAEAALKEYQTKQIEALAQAEAIVKHAQTEAAQMKIQAETDLKMILARHEQHAMDRIRMIEAEALAAVRKSLVNMAMEAARNSFSSKMDEATANRLIDQAISDIPNTKANKAKAA